MSATYLAETSIRATVPGYGYISTGGGKNRVVVDGAPAQRFVDVVEYDTVTRVRRTFSSADGEFVVHGLDPSKEYDVIGRENRRDRKWYDTIRVGIRPVPYE